MDINEVFGGKRCSPIIILSLRHVVQALTLHIAKFHEDIYLHFLNHVRTKDLNFF